MLASCASHTDGVYGFPVGNQTKAVLENSAGVKQRHRYPHDALQPVLSVKNHSVASHGNFRHNASDAVYVFVCV